MVKILAVIPARFQSQRFPGKPLVKLGGRTLIQWVYEAARSCRAFERVIVATDHADIASEVRRFGGVVEMTRDDHPTGTDRVAEVSARHADMEIVVNVQGDQPFVTAKMLETMIAPYLQGQQPHMTTLACPLSEQHHADPNTVKVVCDRKMRALYFSRAPIPYQRVRGKAPLYHHLGLYAFRRDFLPVYASLPPTPLEQCEQLEQLRAMEHGYQIQVGLVEEGIVEVNTPADLAAAEALLSQRRS